MKKIELLKLIEANYIIENNRKLLSIIKKQGPFEKISIHKDFWFPNVKELEKEFHILSKEIEQALNEMKESKKNINNMNCNHQIRLKYYDTFISYSECIFCNKSITSNNDITWERSINRNKYCVDLIAKYQDEENYISEGYTKQEIYEIILNILKDKDDNEEIDLIQEFKKLNLNKCEINEEKKVNENYILIIGGTNKKYIDENYISTNSLKIGINFVEYFFGLLNTKIELIDNKEQIDQTKFENLFNTKNYNLKFANYNTIEELERILSKQKEIPFKIIIDLSKLYEYTINNDTINTKSINLDLKKLFPNSSIIRIEDLSKKDLKQLSDFLKNIQDNNIYAYKNNNYYYLENNENKTTDLENICRQAKKKLKINSSNNM